MRYSAITYGDTAYLRTPVAKQGMLNGKPFTIYTRKISWTLDVEQVFINHFAKSPPCFWLDSALVSDFSRFSYMGNTAGPHAEFVTYDVSDKKVTVESHRQINTYNESIFTYLDRMLRERYASVEGLPFDFNLGFAGYLGYELKADCGADAAHQSPYHDSAFIFADRLIVFDHKEKMTYLVCLDDDEHEWRATQWLDEMVASLQNMAPIPQWTRASQAKTVKQSFRHSPDSYLDLIRECQQQIRRGESYEICLTNMITQHVEIDPTTTYRALRESNPAPYATFLNFPGVAVLSSSPERFLTIDPNGIVESKPIKGTRPRGATREEDEEIYYDLLTNEKDRSENLMIVDLLRNDIGSVSNVGSVYVSNIFSVESYATVHQLVSTVHGKLRRGISAVQCAQAAFPGGSMTGAPKKRSMEIIDRLEAGPRGIYSGSIGFFGLNGSADLSIVIRTIVMTPDDVTVGVGGAILALSDPEEELQEMLLKSKALVSALAETAL